MASKPRKVCKKGHNKDITGRTSDGHCLLCRIDYHSKPHISTQQFCIQGHDTFVMGRDKHGSCAECKRLTYIPHPRQPKQFCPKGHDTFIMGRDKWSQCKECNRFEQRERLHKHRVLLDNAKNKPCADCGVKYDPWVMDFDHLRDKKFTISGKASQGYSLEKLLAEIAKCDVVCSNCHRIRTHKRRIG
jgi:hypothetical protein